MYNNRGKRDILIFPKFKNINLINEVRTKYDRLAKLVEPHITIAFPFKDDMSNEELLLKLRELVKGYSQFKVVFSGISVSEDNYIFLNCIEGEEVIYKLYNEIYEKIIPSHYKKSINYIPHITLGQSTDIEDLKEFNYIFTTIVDEIAVEYIGDNEESIVIGSIKLN